MHLMLASCSNSMLLKDETSVQRQVSPYRSILQVAPVHSSLSPLVFSHQPILHTDVVSAGVYLHTLSATARHAVSVFILLTSAWSFTYEYTCDRVLVHDPSTSTLVNTAGGGPGYH